jgi:hypothetical protein
MIKNPFQRQKQLLDRTAQALPLTPYQQLYGLRENPFPSMALFSPTVDDPRRNGKIYDESFRAEEEQQFFNLFVQPPTGDQPIQLGFIRVDIQAGGRGNGKSVFLHQMTKRINDLSWEDWTTDPDDPSLFALAVHILPEPRQQRRFWQLVHLVFETLAQENLFLAIDVQFRAALLFQLLNDRQIAALAEREAAEVTAILESGTRFRELLGQNKLTIESFYEQAERQLRGLYPTLSDSFLSDFVVAGCELTGLWEKWKQEGIAVSSYQWRKNGVQWLINGLIPVMMVSGYQRFYILLDEFEKIYIYQKSRERDEFLDALRQYFYERDSAAVRHQFMTTVLTIHPSIYRYLDNHWRRVGLDNLAPLEASRIPHISVELGISTVEKLNHLLTTYIDWFRRDGEEKRQGTLYPFADNALEPAIEAARFYPRGTLWYAHTILKKAATEKIPPPITRHFVEEVLKSGVRPPRHEDDELFKLPSSATDLQG